jgi:hypothetical protein
MLDDLSVGIRGEKAAESQCEKRNCEEKKSDEVRECDTNM